MDTVDNPPHQNRLHTVEQFILLDNPQQTKCLQPCLQVTIANQTFVYAKVIVIAAEEDTLVARKNAVLLWARPNVGEVWGHSINIYNFWSKVWGQSQD